MSGEFQQSEVALCLEWIAMIPEHFRPTEAALSEARGLAADGLEDHALRALADSRDVAREILALVGMASPPSTTT